MALINCPECDNQVSDKAVTCPHCGLPSKYFIIKKDETSTVGPKGKETYKQISIDAELKDLNPKELTPTLTIMST